MDTEQRIHNPIPLPVDAAVESGHDNATITSSAPKGGAPKGNVNNLSNGLQSSPQHAKLRLELGLLPKCMRRVEQGTMAFRRLVESVVIDVHGEVNFVHALYVDEAARHYRHGALCLRWLRLHEKTMTHSERMAYSKEIAASATARNRCLERLKLAMDEKSILDSLYTLPPYQDEPEDQPADDNAADAKPEADQAP